MPPHSPLHRGQRGNDPFTDRRCWFLPPSHRGWGEASPTEYPEQLSPGFLVHAQEGPMSSAAPLPLSADTPTGAAVAPARLSSREQMPAAGSLAAASAVPAGDAPLPAPPLPASPAPIQDASCGSGEDPQPASVLPAGPPPAAPFKLPRNKDRDSNDHQQPVPQRGRALAAGGWPDRAAKSEDQHSPGTSTFPGMGPPLLCGVPAVPWSTLCVPLLFAGREEQGPERLWLGPCPGGAGEGQKARGMAETWAAWWGRAVKEKAGVNSLSCDGHGLSQRPQIQGPQMTAAQSWGKGTGQMNLGLAAAGPSAHPPVINKKRLPFFFPRRRSSRGVFELI